MTQKSLRLPIAAALWIVIAGAAYAGSDGSEGGGRPSLGGPIFDITHFDVIPLAPPQAAVDFEQTAYAALFKYRDASGSDRGFESFRVVNWLLASNHSQIVDVWSSLEAFEQHLAQAHSVDFRFAV